MKTDDEMLINSKIIGGSDAEPAEFPYMGHLSSAQTVMEKLLFTVKEDSFTTKLPF